MPSPRTTIGSAAALAAIVGAFTIFGGSNDPAVTTDQRTLAASVFASDDQTEINSDGPVNPGADCSSCGVTLPPGTQPTGQVLLTGEAMGNFDVAGVSLTPTVAGPWLEVHAHNRTAQGLRFSAVVSYAPLPDAGVMPDAAP